MYACHGAVPDKSSCVGLKWCLRDDRISTTCLTCFSVCDMESSCESRVTHVVVSCQVSRVVLVRSGGAVTSLCVRTCVSTTCPICFLTCSSLTRRCLNSGDAAPVNRCLTPSLPTVSNCCFVLVILGSVQLRSVQITNLTSPYLISSDLTSFLPN